MSYKFNLFNYESKNVIKYIFSKKREKIEFDAFSKKTEYIYILQKMFIIQMTYDNNYYFLYDFYYHILFLS